MCIFLSGIFGTNFKFMDTLTLPNLTTANIDSLGWSAMFLMYTPIDPGSLGGHPGSYCIPQLIRVHWVVSQVSTVYAKQPCLAGWSARLLLLTPTDAGLLGWQPGSSCIPQPTMVCRLVSQAPIVYLN